MRPVNHYKPWILSEDRILVKLHLQGKSNKEIAAGLGRTSQAIFSRLMKIKHHPDLDHYNLSRQLANSTNTVETNDPLIGRHVIYGMKLRKIERTYETTNGIKYVKFKNSDYIHEYENIRGSIVEKVKP